MIGEARIYEDGKLVVEVKDRQEHLCNEVYKIVERVGTTLSDEELPDCSTQHEVDG